jgi:hypothetical protein
MAQEHWPEARDEFASALKANQEACDVRLYLGYVQGQLAVWPDAAGSFARAADCFTLAENSIRTQIAGLSEPPPDAWAMRQAEKLQRDLADAIEQGHSAVYNAAVAFTNAGLADRAKPFAARAAELPDYADRVRALLER